MTNDNSRRSTTDFVTKFFKEVSQVCNHASKQNDSMPEENDASEGEDKIDIEDNEVLQFLLFVFLFRKTYKGMDLQEKISDIIQ